MRRSRGKVATLRSIGIAERTTRNSSYSNEKKLLSRITKELAKGKARRGRITKELAKGKARRAVPSWSIPREIWFMVLRPRDPDIEETKKPIVTEAELHNRLLQTTSSKELLAIMREIRERQAANSTSPNKGRRHLPSVPKPCGIGYQTRPPLMKRFKTLIGGLLGHIKRKRDCSGHVANIGTSASR